MKQKFNDFINKIKTFLSKQDWKLIGIISGCLVGTIGFFYIFGLFSQFVELWPVLSALSASAVCPERQRRYVRCSLLWVQA